MGHLKCTASCMFLMQRRQIYCTHDALGLNARWQTVDKVQCQIVRSLLGTSWKIKMEHNNGSLEDDFSLSIGWFLGSNVNFQGCMGRNFSHTSMISLKHLKVTGHHICHNGVDGVPFPWTSPETLGSDNGTKSQTNPILSSSSWQVSWEYSFLNLVGFPSRSYSILFDIIWLYLQESIPWIMHDVVLL